MAKVNGTNFALFRASDDAIIGHSNSCSLTIGADLPDSTTKDSNGFTEVIAGVRNAQFSASGLIRYGDPLNYTELADYVLQRTLVEFYIETGTGYNFQGSGFITNASQTGALESTADFSIEMEIKLLLIYDNPIWGQNDYDTWATTAINWNNA